MEEFPLRTASGTGIHKPCFSGPFFALQTVGSGNGGGVGECVGGSGNVEGVGWGWGWEGVYIRVILPLYSMSANVSCQRDLEVLGELPGIQEVACFVLLRGTVDHAGGS